MVFPRKETDSAPCLFKACIERLLPPAPGPIPGFSLCATRTGRLRFGKTPARLCVDQGQVEGTALPVNRLGVGRRHSITERVPK